MRLITHLSPGFYNAVKFVVFHILVDNILVWSRAKLKRAVFTADLNRGISAPIQSMADNNGRNTIFDIRVHSQAGCLGVLPSPAPRDLSSKKASQSFFEEVRTP